MSCRRSSPDWGTWEERLHQGLIEPDVHLNGEAANLTLKMTLMWSPRGSRFWKDSFRGTALELKKEHNYSTGQMVRTDMGGTAEDVGSEGVQNSRLKLNL